MKFTLENKTNEKTLILNLSKPTLDEVDFYFPQGNEYNVIKNGQVFPFYSRKYQIPDFLFDLQLHPKQAKTCFFRVKATKSINLPVKVGTKLEINNTIFRKNLFVGMYAGIMMVMILYNLFIFFSVHDKSYLNYVVYITFVFLTQMTFIGYTYQYFWPSLSGFEIRSMTFVSSVVGIAAVQFERTFLNTKSLVPKYEIGFKLANLAYLSSFIILLIPRYEMYAWLSTSIIAAPLSLYMLFVAVKSHQKGSKSAKYFLVAWSTFLFGVFIFALKEWNILPYNNFTVYTMPVGSALETVILSFALADRINTLKKEKQQLVQEQNILLEKQVRERTQDLQNTLTQLQVTQEQLTEVQKNRRLQMNPHFLFNALNSMQSMVIKNKRTEAVNNIGEMSQLMRKLLDTSQNDFISLSSEIELLELYLKMEQVRFRDRLNWEINCDPSIHTDTRMVPTMIIQPFVENAVHHGIRPKNKPGYITITFKDKNGAVECIIKDDGIGRDKAQLLKKPLH